MGEGKGIGLVLAGGGGKVAALAARGPAFVAFSRGCSMCRLMAVLRLCHA